MGDATSRLENALRQRHGYIENLERDAADPSRAVILKAESFDAHSLHQSDSMWDLGS
jgi:hypothetical protein